MLTIGSLFSGIGGLELGLEWAGLGPVLWQVERDPFCQRVLARHWPDAARFDDVCSVGAAELTRVDVVCGGFPCQGNSPAGSRTGFAHDGSGLWIEFARIVAEISPSWVVAENVAGGVNWVDRVMADLEQFGYAALSFPLSAADVGAPHLRERVFVVARHSDADGEPVGAVNAQVAQLPRATTNFPYWSKPPRVSVANGFSAGMGAYGNAVVPQCAEVVGHVVRQLAGLWGAGCEAEKSGG